MGGRCLVSKREEQRWGGGKVKPWIQQSAWEPNATASKGTAAEFWENVCTLSPYTWILNHGFIFLLQKIVLKVRENKWVNFPRWWILGLGIDSTSAWPQISGWASVTEETCDLSATCSPFPSSLQFSVRTWPALWRENQTFKNYVGSNKDFKKRRIM